MIDSSHTIVTVIGPGWINNTAVKYPGDVTDSMIVNCE